MRTPNLHRAKIAQQECGWKDGDRGGPAQMKKNLLKEKEKTVLTLTGLLMEGLGFNGGKTVSRESYYFAVRRRLKGKMMIQDPPQYGATRGELENLPLQHVP